jgi:hypothetical protein
MTLSRDRFRRRLLPRALVLFGFRLGRNFSVFDNAPVLIAVQRSERLVNELVKKRREIAICRAKLFHNLDTAGENFVFPTQVFERKAPLFCRFPILVIFSSLMTIIHIFTQNLQRV